MHTSFSDGHDVQTVRDMMGESAEEQLERKCDWIIRELDEVCALATNGETVDLVEGQRVAVGQILTRVQLIAALLMARQPRPVLVSYRR